VATLHLGEFTMMAALIYTKSGPDRTTSSNSVKEPTARLRSMSLCRWPQFLPGSLGQNGDEPLPADSVGPAPKKLDKSWARISCSLRGVFGRGRQGTGCEHHS
jgi:hypothetical protein